MKRTALFVLALVAAAGLSAPAFAGAPASRTQLTRQDATASFAQFARQKRTRGAANTIGDWAKTDASAALGSAAAGSALVGLQPAAAQTQMNLGQLVSGLEAVR